MNTYIAVVFSSDDKAHQALRKLWNLDEKGALTVHGAAVVRRDDTGHIRVADRDSDLGLRTAIGVGVGALLGLMAGPIGVAAGITGAAALSVGAATGVATAAGASAGGVTIAGTGSGIAGAGADVAAPSPMIANTAPTATVSSSWTKIC